MNDKFNLCDKEGNLKDVPKLNLNYGGRTMITKHGAYFLAQRIKQRGKEDTLKGWILLYPFSIDGSPISNNYVFCVDEEYKQNRLSVDYVEILEIYLQEAKKYTIKQLQSFLLKSIEGAIK